MKIRLTKTGKVISVYDGYAERLIEQGMAVAIQEEEFPMNPPEPAEEPEKKTDKPKSGKKGE